MYILRKLILLILIGTISAQNSEYFQQYVSYDIEVSLNDKDHTLYAFESSLS